MSSQNWNDMCLVATVYLVNSAHRVLLSWNKNIQAWIPIGGHMEPGETPQESVRREVREEVGVEFSFVDPHPREHVEGIEVVPAFYVQTHPVPHHRRHTVFVFFGRSEEWSGAAETDENEKLRWFSEEELLAEEGMIPSIRYEALSALRTMRF